MSTSARFTPDPRNVAAARRFVAEALASVGADDEALRDAVAVTSEVVANVVDHARTDFEVTVAVEGALARIAVRDGSAVRLAVRDLVDDAERGRGLRIVDALTESWGVDTLGDGKVVWWRSPLGRRPQPR